MIVEADKLQLPIRRDKLVFQYVYISKVAACLEKNVHTIIFKPKYGGLFEKKPRSVATVHLAFDIRTLSKIKISTYFLRT